MERRRRDRLVMSVFCRITPLASRRRSAWKQIENISSAGMLVVWSHGQAAASPPRMGEQYRVELQLPPHPVFGQRALQFQTKVVRAFHQAGGKLMVGLQSTHSRFRAVAPGSWPDQCISAAIN